MGSYWEVLGDFFGRCLGAFAELFEKRRGVVEDERPISNLFKKPITPYEFVSENERGPSRGLYRGSS